MTLLGWIVVIAGALLVGVVAQLVRAADMPYRWVVTAIGAFLGAAVCSEMLFAGATPDFEGMALWPALIGGLVVGVVVDLVAQIYAGRQSTGHRAVIR